MPKFIIDSTPEAEQPVKLRLTDAGGGDVFVTATKGAKKVNLLLLWANGTFSKCGVDVEEAALLGFQVKGGEIADKE